MKYKDSEIQPLIAVQRDDIQHKKESKKQKYRETKMKRHNIRNKDTKIQRLNYIKIQTTKIQRK